MVDITRETFEGYSVDNKLNTIFDLAVAAEKRQAAQTEKCGGRFVKLEKRKKFNTVFAGFWGLVGGFFAVVFKFLFTG